MIYLAIQRFIWTLSNIYAEGNFWENNRFQSLIILLKSSIVSVWQCPKQASAIREIKQTLQLKKISLASHFRENELS